MNMLRQLNFLSASASGHMRDVLLDRCKPIGVFRRLSIQRNYNLIFKNLYYSSFVCSETLSVNINRLTDNVLRISKHPTLRHTSLERELTDAIAVSNDDPSQLCSGPDCVALLGIALRCVLRKNGRNAISQYHLNAALRLAYSPTLFANTDLYKNSLLWQASNPPYKVFSL